MSISEYFIPFTRIGISLKRSIRVLFHSYHSTVTSLSSINVQQTSCVWTLTGPSGQIGPLYRLVVQPGWARTHRPPGPRFHLGPGYAEACTVDREEWMKILMRKEQQTSCISVWISVFRSPGWCCACVEWGGQYGPPEAWPEPCTRSFALRCPHHQPTQTDSGQQEEKRRKGGAVRRGLTQSLEPLDCWNQIDLYLNDGREKCWEEKEKLMVQLIPHHVSNMVETQKDTQKMVLTSIKVSMLSIRAWARPMMNWLTHAIAWDLRNKELWF